MFYGRKRLSATLLSACITLSILASSAAYPLSWDIETIDSGRGSSLALDGSGYPHISYTYTDPIGYDTYLKYAFYDGSEWHIEILTEDVSRDYSGTSIALDSYGNPHISYINYDNGYYELKYAKFNGSDWDFFTIDTSDWYTYKYTDLSIDSEDNVHIAYSLFWEDDIFYGYLYKYCFYDGYEWDYGPEFGYSSCTSSGIGYVSMTTDSNNTPHLIYNVTEYYGAPHEIYYTNGYDWQETTLGEGNYGLGITVDTQDCLHAAYRNFNDYGIVYAFFDGIWQSETIEALPDCHGNSLSIAVTSDNLPCISAEVMFYDMKDKYEVSLKYVFYNGYTWLVETIEEVYPSSILVSLDSFNNPSIVYVDYIGSNSLKYAIGHNTPPSSFNLAQPPDGAEVAEPVTLDWEDSTDDDGDAITYDLWYATDPSFDPHDEVTELTESTYTFPEGVLTQGETYYWKVRAWDGYDETWSGPDPYWSFTVEEEVTDIPVTAFSAESARDGVELTWECAEPSVGFNLYRSTEATGVRTKLRETLNAGLITGESPYAYLDAEVSDGVTYSYWLEAIDVGGSSETFGPVSCTAGTFVPSSYALYQSRPNPARGTAVIAFDLPEDTDVTITIYDLSGRKVTTLVNGTLPAGTYERPVAGLAPGVYVYRLDAGEFSGVRKMVVVQ